MTDTPMLDFSAFSADRTKDFARRGWIFARIERRPIPPARRSSSSPASPESARGPE